MYTYIETVSLIRDHGLRWVSVVDDSALVKEVYSNSVKSYLVLENPYVTHPIHLDLDDLDETHRYYEGTIAELLELLADLTLPHTDPLPRDKVRYARYENATRLRYKFELAKVGYNAPPNYPVESLRDLRMYRTLVPTDPRIVHKNCLVSVNGFYHRSDSDKDYLYVYEGGRSVLHSRVNNIGLLSFQDLGGVVQESIEPGAIHPVNPEGTLKEKMVINIQTPLENSTVILILGGYLVFPEEGVFWQQGDQSYILDINRIPYMERLFESSPYIDLEPLGLTKSTLNELQLHVEEVYSDEVLRNYLCLKQSFLAIVPKSYLTMDTLALRNGLIPGFFTAYQEPIYPLRIGHGRMSEYWKRSEQTRWTATVYDSYKRNYIISYRDNNEYTTVSDQVLPENGFRHGPGYLVRIGGFDL